MDDKDRAKVNIVDRDGNACKKSVASKEGGMPRMVCHARRGVSLLPRFLPLHARNNYPARRERSRSRLDPVGRTFESVCTPWFEHRWGQKTFVVRLIPRCVLSGPRTSAVSCRRRGSRAPASERASERRRRRRRDLAGQLSSLRSAN